MLTPVCLMVLPHLWMFESLKLWETRATTRSVCPSFPMLRFSQLISLIIPNFAIVGLVTIFRRVLSQPPQGRKLLSTSRVPILKYIYHWKMSVSVELLLPTLAFSLTGLIAPTRILSRHLTTQLSCSTLSTSSTMSLFGIFLETISMTRFGTSLVV